MLVTSTDYEYPYSHLPVKMFNSIGRLYENLGLSSSLNIETLTANAIQKTSLEDFGGDSRSDALEVLVNSINNEGEPNTTVRMI